VAARARDTACRVLSYRIDLTRDEDLEELTACLRRDVGALDGCAVDLTLYRLRDGRAVEMPGVYDEMSERSHPDFPGGTSEQRWHRDLLRAVMEAEGFVVFEVEWWHFDFREWREYPILNLAFERLSARP